MKKIFKAFIWAILTVTTVFSVSVFVFLVIPTKTELNVKSLENTNDFTTFYDRHNNVITTSSTISGKLYADKVTTLTKQAFIASEDKRFYSHHGIDILRIIKAVFIDLKNANFSQGASTITQQLVKNTQLSGKKTISRKLKEIKLAQKMETEYTKDQILDMYLNTIYFGENRYGIESASRYYFRKSADELTLSEASLLAATIRSPSDVNPSKNTDKLKEKQKDVLNRMVRCGYISQSEAQMAFDENPTVYTETDDITSPYITAAINEVISKTDLTPYDLKNCSVYTAYDQTIQKTLYSANERISTDLQAIVIENESGFISGYYSTCGEILRSPASTIKPLAVYAPAIEKGVITQYTVINDEKTTIDGYTPTNYNDNYSGAVTAREALSLSLNVPAVKILNSIGTNYADQTLKKLGIECENTHLNLALGHTGKGVLLKTLVGGYTVFPNNGIYKTPCFVRKIVDNSGKIIYSYDEDGVEVFAPSTAAVVTDMLVECVNGGTAKKLNVLDFAVAAKTGTYGNEKGNVDAYCISYTTDKTVGVWLGNADSSYMDNSLTGGGKAALLNAIVLNDIYDDHKPEAFVYKDVKYVEIDKFALENDGKVLAATEQTPEKYRIKGLFKSDVYPNGASDYFLDPKTSDESIVVKDNSVKISYNKPDIYKVKIYRKTDEGKRLVYEGKDKTFTETVEDGRYEYSIIAFVKGAKGFVYGKEIFLPVVTTERKERLTPFPDGWWNRED